MNNTERNRALLTDLFAAPGREGWGEVFLAALRDDVVFNAMGRSPIAGHYEGKRVYSEEVLAKLHDRLLVRPTLVVDKIIVDGDMASVRFHSTGGKGKNGADFSTDYCWVFRLIDGAIAEIWGYYDTGKMIDLFGERPLSVGTAEGRCGASSFRPPSCDRSARLLHDAESAPGFRHVEEDLCGLSAFKDARV
jgi:ketosteroid isomerase-like protein